ncbi:unnamed protein product [Prorocentrum cordatum]|uniref:Uncharacterized protein n=1 Tax=Prorocentrum cordatum TaxID=2364126 RepID=A0ABN9Y140_9DINO|nr:unnamed protein product [Polarella glacialis]
MISHADACGTAFLWTNLQPSVMKSLQKRGIIKDPNTCFSELDHAVYKVEETILQYRREMVSKWLQVHPAFQFRYKQISLARFLESGLPPHAGPPRRSAQVTALGAVSARQPSISKGGVVTARGHA